MSNPDQQIADLRKQVSVAQQRHATARAGVTGAEARAAQTSEEMRAEFGVGTVEEAEELLVTLRTQVDAQAAVVRRYLEESR